MGAGLLLLALGDVAHSRDWYVRTSGDDAAGGTTPATAFATIGRAASAIENAGDRVIVGPGVYVDGNILPARSGVEGRPVEFLGDVDGVHTGDPAGTIVLTPPAEKTTGFLIAGRRYVVIDGFSIVGAIDAGIQVRSGSVGQTLLNSAEITIRNTVVTSSLKTGIDVHVEGAVRIQRSSTIGNGGSGIAIDGCIEPSMFCIEGSSAGANVTLLGNVARGNAAHGMFLRQAKGGVLQNNRLFQNGATGVTHREGANLRITNNLVYANSEDGIAGGTADLPVFDTTITHNTVYGNTDSGIRVGTASSSSPGNFIVHNLVHGNGVGIAVARASACDSILGFNLNTDGYASGTRFNDYDFDADPLFVDPDGADNVLGGDGYLDDDFRLQQRGGGQTQTSPAVDAGSATARVVNIGGSTASGGRADVGSVDIGFHYDVDDAREVDVAVPFMPIYVSKTGDDSNTGTLPEAALASIRAAWMRAVVGVTVIVGPGTYREGNVRVRSFSGPLAFVADVGGRWTGSFPGRVLVDATDTDTGFVILNPCGRVEIDGFDVTGAFTAGIQIRAGADGAVVRNNRTFENHRRGVDVQGANGVTVQNNAVYANGTGGVRLSTSDGSVVENNTVYGNGENGIFLGGSTPDLAVPNASVIRNVLAQNSVGVQVSANSLAGYLTAFNVVADGFSGGTPRADSDFVGDPLLVNPPEELNLRQDDPVSPAIDIDPTFAHLLVRGSTRSDGAPDLWGADAGFHAPLTALAWPDDRVGVPLDVRFVRASGSDGNSGRSPEQAFRTIRAALAALSTNGIAVVGPGAYAEERLTIGSPNAGVLFVMGDERGTLTGDAPGRVSIRSSRGVYLRGRAVLQGLTLTGAAGAGLRISRQAAGSVVRDSAICDNGGIGVFADTADLGLVNNLVVGNGQSGIIVFSRRTHESLQVLNNTIAANDRHGLLLRQAKRARPLVVVANNIVSANAGRGIAVRTVSGVVLSHNLNTDGYGRGTAPGEGSLEADPAFVAPPPGSDRCGGASSFQLSPASPAIDAGRGAASDLGIAAAVVASGLPDSGPTDLGYHFATID